MDSSHKNHTRYVAKQKPESRFGFNFDEDEITFRTDIPSPPEHPKHKPDARQQLKKIDDIAQKLKVLKEERATKKNLFEQSIEAILSEIASLNANIDLGQKCKDVLKEDIRHCDYRSKGCDEKIRRLRRQIRNLVETNTHEGEHYAQTPKTLQEMTYAQLVAEQKRIYTVMSLGELNKKQEKDHHARLAKISALKVEVKKEDTPKPVSSSEPEKQRIEAEISKIQEDQKRFTEKQAQAHYKIECISEDCQGFKEKLEELMRKKQESELSGPYVEANAIKEQIYALRKQVVKIQEEIQKRQHDYDVEQEKIKWINWATEVKARRQAELEREKQYKKSQRQREDNFSKETKGVKDEAAAKDKTDQETPAAQPPRRIPNPHQTEIDTAAFLISYCKDLQLASRVEEVQAAPAGPDLTQIQKSVKLEGLEVIQPKKSRKEDQEDTRRNKKNKPVKQEPVTSFNHDFFRQQAFDSLKVLPPTKPSELESTMKQLEDLLIYYSSRMDNGTERPQHQEPTEMRRQQQKPYSKIVPSHAEFPALS